MLCIWIIHAILQLRPHTSFVSHILSIETATKTCSIALHSNGHLISCQALHVAQSHAESLMAMIQHTLSISRCAKKDLAAVAISAGPGSYTGLRIGASTAQGLSYALRIPLIAVNTLDAMVHGIMPYNHQKAFLCPVIDARRMEVYCLVADPQGKRLIEPHPHIVHSDSFATWLGKGPVIFFGDGAAKCQATLAHQPQAIFLAGIHPSAKYVGEVAYQKFEQKDFTAVDEFTPTYLKAFQTKAAN